MGVVLFFGMAAFILICTTAYTFVVFRHYWADYKKKRALKVGSALQKPS